MTTRARLPNRRYREGFTLEHRGIRYEVCIGRNVTAIGPAAVEVAGARIAGPVRIEGDGTLGEIFFSCTKKAGADADADARDTAFLFSLAIQYGVPLELIKAGLLRDAGGKSAGLLGRVLDLIGEGA